MKNNGRSIPNIVDPFTMFAVPAPVLTDTVAVVDEESENDVACVVVISVCVLVVS